MTTGARTSATIRKWKELVIENLKKHWKAEKSVGHAGKLAIFEHDRRCVDMVGHIPCLVVVGACECLLRELWDVSFLMGKSTQNNTPGRVFSGQKQRSMQNGNGESETQKETNWKKQLGFLCWDSISTGEYRICSHGSIEKTSSRIWNRHFRDKMSSWSMPEIF